WPAALEFSTGNRQSASICRAAKVGRTQDLSDPLWPQMRLRRGLYQRHAQLRRGRARRTLGRQRRLSHVVLFVLASRLHRSGSKYEGSANRADRGAKATQLVLGWSLCVAANSQNAGAESVLDGGAKAVG